MPTDRVTFSMVESVKLVEMEETGNYRVEITQENGRKNQVSSFEVSEETADDIKDVAEYRENDGHVETNFPENPVFIPGDSL